MGRSVLTNGDDQRVSYNVKPLQQQIGELTKLGTTDKTSLVNALNEVKSEKEDSSLIGDLTELNTSDKSNLVAAINDNVAQLAANVNQLSGVVQGKTFDKGIASIILDDGTEDHYTNAYPLFSSRGIPFGMALDIQNILRYGVSGGRVSYAQLVEMYNTGLLETLCHSMTHTRLDNTITTDRTKWEMLGAKELIKSLGFDVKNFVAPYDAFDQATDKMNILENNFSAGFINYFDPVNGTPDQINLASPIDVYQLKRINASAGLTKLKACLDYAEANKTWVIIYAHKVLSSGGDITPTDLGTLLDYVQTKNVDVLNTVDVLPIISTRTIAKERPDINNRDLVDVSSKGNEVNLLTNTAFSSKAGTLPDGWSWTPSYTGGVTTSIVKSTPANVFTISLDGTNTGTNEQGLLQQTLPITNLTEEPLPLVLSVRGRADLGTSNVQLQVKFVAKDASGNQLYYKTQTFGMSTLYRDYEISDVIPRDSAITQLTVAIYPINQTTNHSAKFWLWMPKLEIGTKRSKWKENTPYGSSAVTKDYVEATNRTATTSIPASTYTKMSFDTAFSTMTNNCYSTTTNTFTATHDGNYIVDCKTSFLTGVDQARYMMALYKNGASYKVSEHTMNGTSHQGINLSMVINLKAGDTLSVYAWHGSTGNTFNLSFEPYTYLTIAEM